MFGIDLVDCSTFSLGMQRKVWDWSVQTWRRHSGRWRMDFLNTRGTGSDPDRHSCSHPLRRILEKIYEALEGIRLSTRGLSGSFTRILGRDTIKSTLESLRAELVEFDSRFMVWFKCLSSRFIPTPQTDTAIIPSQIRYSHAGCEYDTSCSPSSSRACASNSTAPITHIHRSSGDPQTHLESFFPG